ncbi:hypothetical protein CHUAL_013040 [Chamberlinius hualienensis]
MFGVSIRLGPFRQFVLFMCVLALLCFYKGWFPFRTSIHKSVSLKELLKASVVAAEKGGFQVKLAHKQSNQQVSSKGKTKEGANDPLTEADIKSHFAITRSLAEFSKGSLKIISEEHNYENPDAIELSFEDFSPGEITGLPAEDDTVNDDDVVIWVDPLDATQEFTENLLQYVTVMVCITVKGQPTIGVIHKPFEDKTIWAWVGRGHSSHLKTPDQSQSKTANDALNIIVSRSHKGKVEETASKAFGSNIKVIPAGGAGYKVLQVCSGEADAYVHVTMIKKWDICAGNAILYALGGNMTTLIGEKLAYGPYDNEKNEDGLLATIYNHQKYLNGLKKLYPQEIAVLNETELVMGNLLRLLYRDDAPKRDIFVDFENAQPTPEEEEAYYLVEATMKDAYEILYELQQYKGAGNEIREAIGNPRSEVLQDRAWAAVLPLVSKLKRFYEFSLKLAYLVPKILWELCSGDMTPMKHLETQQALVKQFAQILEFVLNFDDLKMTNPAIQNDFSYYRRTVSRLRMTNQELNEDEMDVPNELANRMSLFYAHATPMLKMLSEATAKFVYDNKDIPIENTTETLGTMAKVCQRMVDNPSFSQRFKNEETVLFVLRVMVGLIILYDHVHPVGAFSKNSHVDIKGCIKVLKEQPPSSAEGLLNALRYTTKHLNDEGTPKHIKHLLS